MYILFIYFNVSFENDISLSSNACTPSSICALPCRHNTQRFRAISRYVEFGRAVPLPSAGQNSKTGIAVERVNLKEATDAVALRSILGRGKTSIRTTLWGVQGRRAIEARSRRLKEQHDIQGSRC